MGWDDLNWLEDVHMGYEEDRPAVFDRNANGWVTIPKKIKLPDNQQDREIIARELLVKFQMSPRHPLVDLKKAYKIGQDMYVEEDNFWKNANWLLERNRFDTAFKNLGIDETNFKDALKGKGVSRNVRNFLNDSVERFYDKSTGTFKGNYE